MTLHKLNNSTGFPSWFSPFINSFFYCISLLRRSCYDIRRASSAFSSAPLPAAVGFSVRADTACPSVRAEHRAEDENLSKPSPSSEVKVDVSELSFSFFSLTKLWFHNTNVSKGEDAYNPRSPNVVSVRNKLSFHFNYWAPFQSRTPYTSIGQLQTKFNLSKSYFL